MVDVPGFSLTAVHCHGNVRYDVQVGATGPMHNNPCYEVMNGGSTASTHGEMGLYFVFPIGNKFLYRCSVNDSPWRYYVGDPIPADPFGPSMPYIPPCPS